MFEQLYQNLEELQSVQGVTRAKVLTLPEPLLGLLNTLMRRGCRGGMTLRELVGKFQLTESETLQIAEILIEKGYLYSIEDEDTGESLYGVRFGQKRGRDLPLELKTALQQLKEIQLIEVKSEIGAGTRGSSLGSDAMKTASFQFNRKFFQNYPALEIQSENQLLLKSKTYRFAKRIDGMIKLYERISKAVKTTLEQGALPVVISGDHSTAGGTIAGIKMAFPQSRLGVVWIDAHADIHSPYTTPSGNMHGMPVATAMGEDNLDSQVNTLDEKTIDYWNQIKNLGGISPKIAYEDLVYVAVRDTEPAEDYLIKKHNIKNFTTAELRKKGVAQVVKETWAILESCDRIYISFDVDSMDPSIVSEGTGTPVAGGITDLEAGQLISRLIQNGKVCCFEICEINPMLDPKGNRMAESAFAILESATNKMSSTG
jgi:arginase